MPRVGARTFKYTKAGKKAAKKFAKRTGKKITKAKSTKKGKPKGKMKKISFLSIISTLIITSCVSPNPPKLVVVLISDQADPNILEYQNCIGLIGQYSTDH